MRSPASRRASSLVRALSAARIEPPIGNIRVGSNPSAAEMLTMAPPPAARNSGRAARDKPQCAHEQQLERIEPGGVGQRQRIASGRVAGVVHQYVEPAPAFSDAGIDQPGNVRRLRQVAAHGEAVHLLCDGKNLLTARHEGQRWYPSAASCRAQAAPIPRLAAVTIATPCRVGSRFFRSTLIFSHPEG